MRVLIIFLTFLSTFLSAQISNSDAKLTLKNTNTDSSNSLPTKALTTNYQAKNLSQLSDEETWTIGLRLFDNATELYQQKRYQDAIEQFTLASTYFVSPNVKTQKKRGGTFKMIAQSYKRLKNREQTALYYKKALDVFTAIDDKRNIARTLNTLAEAQRYLNNLVDALDYSIQGLQLHKQIDDPQGYAKSLTGAGIIYRHIGRYEKSLTHIYQAHLYYKQVNNVEGIANTSNQLGFIYIRLKQFDQATAFLQITINSPTDQVKPFTLASAFREMSIIYLQSKDYEMALKMSERAYQIYQSLNDKLRGSVSAKIIADIYFAQNNNQQATEFYKESMRLAEQSGDIKTKIQGMITLGVTLINSDIEQASDLFYESLDLATQINNQELILLIYSKLRHAEKLRGNIDVSLQYAEQEIKLLETIQNTDDSNKYKLTKAFLYSHKMELELESLKEKNKLDQLELVKKENEIEIAKQTRKITDLQLEHNKNTNTLLVLSLLLCAFLVIYIYRRFIVSKKKNRELDYLAARDPLTNCYNRRVLINNMDRVFENPNKLDEYCIIMADIDHFKSINDTHGHNAGDNVICGVANILQTCVRQNDIVARYGGEEFCIIIHNVTPQQAMHIAETMRKKIEDSRFNDVAVTCSFGVSSINYNATTSAQFISQADLALYKSKSLGRNQVNLWEKTLEKRK
ncbi:GGDEF domain-containing protein [Psychrosphaera sp. F3M07]|uniref:tetratricopeptide repeat-containing diguanylate cyclase n=1 Tax=Psychrosphaera sp. F3M07 TaxID=2841560 RepID=UPI001C0905DC|nr:tetratricopeptide repeat-containing diguanylate cyclase [Psychrosphaera sp. F3M07]MBU2918501.1 GGDEF domain-containing protein [Psychrosphaera sp. F3M07]